MSSDNSSSVPDELDSDISSEGQLGMRDDDNSAEADDYDDEMISEEGEDDMSEEDEQPAPSNKM